MTAEQRIALRAALKEVHDQIHHLYPRNESATDSDKRLRDQLLVVDLVVHLADEVIDGPVPDQQKVTERTANLLFAVRLIARDYPFTRAAELLLEAGKTPTD